MRIKVKSGHIVYHDGEFVYSFTRVWQVEGGGEQPVLRASFETAIAEADRRARGLSAALREVP